MRAQLASIESFRQAGLDYGTTLLGIKFVIEKRANGQAIIKLSSDKPINDPFVDMLLELNWPSGRLIREYTFLLDPPEVAAKAAALSASAVAKPVAPARPAAAAPVDKPEALRPRAREEARAPADVGDTHEVKRGETLRKIAGETKPEGVSLEQMLVGLFRANHDAFDGGNMNRLKAGKILSVPEKGAVEAVSEGEAKKIVLAQSSDWNAYRRKLAAVAAQAPAKEEAGKQDAAGKITARVEDKAAPAAEPKDQVKVSKTDAAGGKAGAAAKRSEEDLIAKEKALQEANERLASLEKNVAELQKLVEMKNQSLAELQKQAASKAVPAETKAPETAAVPPPAPAPAAVVAETPSEKPAEVKPSEPAIVKPEEAKPEVKPESKPVEPPKPAPVAPPPAPAEEPGFVEELLGSPVVLAAGGLLALLAGYFVYKRRRPEPGEVPLAMTSTLSQQSGGLSGNSVFRSTGGQSVDTSHTPAQTDFSQAGPGSIDTDEVDPVAEADVYMAYGRDAQAEEILLEARQKDPKRYAIHLKLLEIYSNRKNIKQFETLAADLYSETGGVGVEWEKAAAMGLKLDPQNPLFGAAAQQEKPAFDADATVIVSSQSLKNMAATPAPLSPLAEAAGGEPAPLYVPDVPRKPEPAVQAPAEPADLMSLDFDLGAGDAAAPSPPAEHKPDFATTMTLPEAMVDTGGLDFDIGASPATGEKPVVEETSASAVDFDFNLPDIALTNEAAAAPTPEEAETAAALDFDLGIESTPVAPTEREALADTESVETFDIGSVDDSALEFDVGMTESPVLGQPAQMPSFDLSSISLDLEQPASAGTPKAGSAAEEVSAAAFETTQIETVVNPDFSTQQAETVVNPQFGTDLDSAPDLDITPSEEVATKLDLAKAYEEMGDFEGARELLQEVLKEGDATQREKAQAILAKIGE